MSSETGTVTTLAEDGTPGPVVGWFIYYGTCGVARPRIHPTREAAWEFHVRGETSVDEAACTCGNPSVPVVLQTSYGGGIRWHSRACITCGAITGYRDEFAEMQEQERRDPWGFSGMGQD